MCHNDASGQVLGFSLRQLDVRVGKKGRHIASGDGPTDGDGESQIDRLIRLGVLAESAANVPEWLARRFAALDDESATLEHRARSYLDANCSSCHNPQTRFAAFDARISRDLGEQGLVDGRSYYHKDRGPDVRIVRPGDVALSMLHHRLSTDDPSQRMPPLGTSVVDRDAAELIAAWIESLAPKHAAPEQSAPVVDSPTPSSSEKPSPEKPSPEKPSEQTALGDSAAPRK
jgi:mono/diheme cytochrome c family protein